MLSLFQSSTSSTCYELQAGSREPTAHSDETEIFISPGFELHSHAEVSRGLRLRMISSRSAANSGSILGS